MSQSRTGAGIRNLAAVNLGYPADIPRVSIGAMSLDFDVFVVNPKPIPSAVPVRCGGGPGDLAAVHLDADQ